MQISKDDFLNWQSGAFQEVRLIFAQAADEDPLAILQEAQGSGDQDWTEESVSFDPVADDGDLEQKARNFLGLPDNSRADAPISVTDIGGEELSPAEARQRTGGAEEEGHFAAPEGTGTVDWTETDPVLEQVSRDTGRATKAILGIHHSWVPSIRSGFKLPRTMKLDVARLIDRANGRISGLGEAALRTAQMQTKHVGEREMEELARLRLREEEAKKSGVDLTNRLKDIMESKRGITQTRKEIPAWRVGLKAQALWLDKGDLVREPLKRFLRIQTSEARVKMAKTTVGKVEGQAVQKRKKIEARFKKKLQSDDRMRTRIFKKLKLTDDPANHRIIDELARSNEDFEFLHYTSQGTPVGKFLDQMYTLPRAQRKEVELYIRSMRSSVLGEANAADFRATNRGVQEEIEAREASERSRQRVEQASRMLETGWQEAMRKRLLVKDATISLSFHEKGALNGPWIVTNAYKNGFELRGAEGPISSRTLKVRRSEQGQWSILDGSDDIFSYLEGINFPKSKAA